MRIQKSTARVYCGAYKNIVGLVYVVGGGRRMTQLYKM